LVKLCLTYQRAFALWQRPKGVHLAQRSCATPVKIKKTIRGLKETTVCSLSGPSNVQKCLFPVEAQEKSNSPKLEQSILAVTPPIPKMEMGCYAVFIAYAGVFIVNCVVNTLNFRKFK
jgi:hypothetical protein